MDSQSEEKMVATVDAATFAQVPYPKVLVVGEAATGKTTVISKVLASCASSPAGNICAEVFWEGNLPIDAVQTRQLAMKADKADAVWIVISATRQLQQSEIKQFRELSARVRYRAVVVTNLDSIDEPHKKDVREFVRKQFLDAEIISSEDLIVDGSGRCSELVDFYWKLCDDKADVEAQRKETARMAEYYRIVKSGLLEFDFDRYRDSIFYYCMPHDQESEDEYKRTMKPPFGMSETFKKRIRLVLQTPAPQLYLDHPDLRDIPAKGSDLIQAIQHGFEYWRDNAVDEAIASKAKYVVDKIEESSCEMGVVGNVPSVVDYVDDVLEYAASKVNEVASQRRVETDSQTPASTATVGAISGYALVENILNHFGDKGVEKLLECTHNQETEYLELKTSYLLSDDDRKNGFSQDELNWNIAQGVIAIANTAGGALVIGVGSDNRTLFPVEVAGDREDFLRRKIIQKVLPEQRKWNGGKKGRWQADDLPRVEPRLCTYSDGEKSGLTVVLLIEPRPKGLCITLEDAVNRNSHLLLQRKDGVGGKLEYKEDFSRRDNERRIERGKYASLLREMIPDAGIPPTGGSSGAYRFKKANETDTSADPLIRRTEGHHLRCDFNPGDRIDKYEIIEKIGSGGMGVVYKAKHFAKGGEFALKAFKTTPENSSMTKERFVTEAKLLERLHHAGLPKFIGYDYDDTAECLYLVQELIVGADGKPQELDKYVVDAGENSAKGLKRISYQQAAKWLRQVCEIAEYLHRARVAHRDITMKNLLVDAEENIKLTDFGIAKIMDPELRDALKSDVTMTMAQVPGTSHYLPPEVIDRRTDDVSAEATDVWAIGVSFFKLLTGKWPDHEQYDEYVWYKTIWAKIFKGMINPVRKQRWTCAKVLEALDAAERMPGGIDPVINSASVTQDGKLRRNPEDHELDFLFNCTREELEPIVAAILGTVEVDDGQGGKVKKIDVKGRTSSELDKQALFKEHFPDHTKYVSDIIAEVQRFGGDSVMNTFRGYGVAYHEVLVDVAKNQKVKCKTEQATDEIELSLLKKVLSDAWDKMSEQDRAQFITRMSDGSIDLDNLSGLLKAFGTGGLVAGNIAASIATAVSQQLVGRAFVSFAQVGAMQAGAGSVLGILAGPIGWAISGAFAVWSLSSTAFRVTTPACIYIAALRRTKRITAN